MITAVFNRQRTIGDALHSLYGQDYGDFEHVVVDGGSTDGTLDVLRQYDDPRMSVVSEPDGGIYDALNKGMARASGDVVGVLHSDDFLAGEHVLNVVAQAFEDDDVDAVYGDLRYVLAHDTARTVRYWRAGAFRPSRLRRGWMPPHPALFVRRRLVAERGAYDTRFKIAADYDAILRWFGGADVTARYVPQVLVNMRTGGASNGSLSRLVRKSCEDYLAMRRNGTGGMAALAWKSLSKLPQFIVHRPPRVPDGEKPLARGGGRGVSDISATRRAG